MSELRVRLSAWARYVYLKNRAWAALITWLWFSAADWKGSVHKAVGYYLLCEALALLPIALFWWAAR